MWDQEEGSPAHREAVFSALSETVLEWALSEPLKVVGEGGVAAACAEGPWTLL